MQCTTLTMLRVSKNEIGVTVMVVDSMIATVA